jgi:hypothetical protein
LLVSGGIIPNEEVHPCGEVRLIGALAEIREYLELVETKTHCLDEGGIQTEGAFILPCREYQDSLMEAE